MLELVLVFLTIVAITIASYTDLKDKKREIPNWVSWGLVGVGILGHAVISLTRWSFTPLFYSLAAAVIFFAIANITFYAGFWGGGDAKLLIGVAAAVPVYPLLLSNYFNPALAPWPFLLSLTMNIVILGSAYGLLYMIFKAAVNLKKFGKEFLHWEKKIRLRYFFLPLLLIPILFLTDWMLAPTLALLIAFIPAVPTLFIFSRAIEKVLVYEQKVSELVPGDRPVKNIRQGGKKVYARRIIGLTEEDIKRIKSMCGAGTKIKLRDGIPYTPSFLIGLLFTLIAGDIIVVIATSILGGMG